MLQNQKSNKQQLTIQQPQQEAATYAFFTVKQFCEKHSAFKVGGIRGQIFNENINGLKEHGAIVRIGRKVLINESRYFEWVASQNAEVSK